MNQIHSNIQTCWNSITWRDLESQTWNKNSSMWSINLLGNRSRKKICKTDFAFLHWFWWKVAFWCILQLSNFKLTNHPISQTSMLWRWRDGQMMSNNWNRMLSLHDSANFSQPFLFRGDHRLWVESIEIPPGTAFWSFENCNILQASITVSLLVFCMFNKNLTKRSNSHRDCFGCFGLCLPTLGLLHF